LRRRERGEARLRQSFDDAFAQMREYFVENALVVKKLAKSSQFVIKLNYVILYNYIIKIIKN
jgi:hypothetical protein